MSRSRVPWIIRASNQPHNDDQTREAARKAGACGYVLKENLIAIREFLGSFESLNLVRSISVEWLMLRLQCLKASC